MGTGKRGTARGALGKIVRLWPYVLLLIGIVGLARPVAEVLRESWDTQQGISRIESEYSDMEDEERDWLISQATLYNTALLSAMPLDGLLPYPEQLAYGDTDMIAHLSVPSLSLNLPIFHGTDENTLMTGVGHLEGSALPIGTPGGRCVLAGHSGMPNARMFDDIRLLDVGDRFVVWTLGEARAYEVIETKVVWPEATEELIPIPGEDLVTLVTCTPYGVNTHRLLVTGRRCEYVPDEEVIPDIEVYVNQRSIPLLVACATTGLVALVGIVSGIVRKVKMRKRSRV